MQFTDLVWVNCGLGFRVCVSGLGFDGCALGSRFWGFLAARTVIGEFTVLECRVPRNPKP